MLKRLRQRLSWRLAGYAAAVLAVGGLYFWHLGSLTPGLAAGEVQASGASRSLEAIWQTPLNAPHKLLQYAASLMGRSAFNWRLASTLLALIFLGCFLIILRLWLGGRAALFGLLVFGATPWLVLVGRSASPTIIWLWPLAVAACLLWWSRTVRYQNLALYISILSLGLALYIPGLVWFLVLAVIFGRRHLAKLLKRHSRWAITLGCLLLILVLAPLVRSLALNQTDWSTWLALPSNWSKPLEIAKSLGRMAVSLDWRSPGNVNWLIDHLPIFNSAQTALAFIGLASLFLAGHKRQAWLLLGWVALAILLAGVNQNAGFLTIGLPVIGALAAAGVYYLWSQWHRVFPRNPLAKGLAVGLVTLLFVLQVTFGARYCLTAWPHAPTTRATYVLQ